MIPRGAAAAVLAVLMVGALGEARADKFEELAKDAVPLDGAQVGTLFWSVTADCSRAQDDLLRRACVEIQRQHASESQNKTFLVRADAGSVVVGDWDQGKSELPVEIKGCIACVAPVDVGEAKRFVVSRGASTFSATGFSGPTIGKAVHHFPNDTTALEWKSDVAPRLRTELVVKVPAQLEQVGHGDTTAYTMEVLGWRTYDPCDGVILGASPSSGPATPDKTTCKGGAAVETATTAPVDDTPYELSSNQIKDAMDGTSGAVDTCYQTYGVTGTADLRVDIASDGHVANIDLKGDFVDTPTGECVTTAVKKVVFPRFKRTTQSIHYPIMIR